ncbi:MAG: riboflavin synthase [Clostridium sp.]|nr:riboflavin synthase [Clostridium sp.]MCM1398387.1 riboflavin synthase [Clostridium sp.]MCM1458948.1 riboflavin synthase [Bacteroides sp.]
MFTGIVEEVGVIRAIDKGAKSERLTICGDVVTKDTHVGDSIAVNGICLTVTSINGNCFTADVMAETMRRTSLSVLAPKGRVNLERAMALNGRFGGHIVSGHIDGTGTIGRLEREDNAVWITIHTTENILRYIIEKGSIAIDGVSLTVAYVDDKCFQVSVIPHTAAKTTLLTKKQGDVVNLENDVIGKYVEKLMPHGKAGSREKTSISEAFLMENGFM